ncbi:MAG TPA: hypothetical protein VFL97_10310 [Nitrococcus sp.]|nr:hypothetical protein [Nitrococcus sp.]
MGCRPAPQGQHHPLVYVVDRDPHLRHLIGALIHASDLEQECGEHTGGAGQIRPTVYQAQRLGQVSVGDHKAFEEYLVRSLGKHDLQGGL